MRGFRPLP
ncbi:hypothetical protein YPPY54_2406, partial [Yersinia pestis PY-54]